jgi:hypothetical protein
MPFVTTNYYPKHRGEEKVAKKSICMLTVFRCAHCFYICRQQLLPHITKQVVIVVVEIETSETC